MLVKSPKTPHTLHKFICVSNWARRYSAGPSGGNIINANCLSVSQDIDKTLFDIIVGWKMVNTYLSPLEISISFANLGFFYKSESENLGNNRFSTDLILFLGDARFENLVENISLNKLRTWIRIHDVRNLGSFRIHNTDFILTNVWGAFFVDMSAFWLGNMYSNIFYVLAFSYT